MAIRVRFAPSPTGYLHIGGARTALFNWLYARHTGGAFILRIEDTDTARNTQAAVEAVLEGLRWLGMDWDEGPVDGNPDSSFRGAHGPYFQSRRMEIYRRRIRELKDKGVAYDHEGAVKFRMPRKPVTMHDLVAGEVTRELTDREQVDPDFVIVRSDGQPVFHLVNVVDDLEMGITHVIRGEDHLSNTPKHIALFEAFGAPPPAYAHIPLILNPDGTKMSKRDTGASLAAYREEGYAPEAVLNYLCLLGWSPKDNREILAPDEIARHFDLSQIVRHNARFDLDKLNWLQGEHVRLMSGERFLALAVPALRRAGVEVDRFPAAYVRAALATCKGKKRRFSELAEYGGFYFKEVVPIPEDLAQRILTPEARALLRSLRDEFSGLESFNAATLEETLKSTAQRQGVKPGALVHPIRLACTGSVAGPSLYDLLEVLGREEVLRRLDAGLGVPLPGA